MDSRLIRDRIDDARDVLDRTGLAGRRSGAPARAGRVVDDGAIPTAIPKFFAVAPIGAVSGDEVEGGAGSDSAVAAAARDYVYVLGPNVPVAGDALLYYGAGDRWTADYSRGGCATIRFRVPGCNGLRPAGIVISATGPGGTSSGTTVADADLDLRTDPGSYTWSATDPAGRLRNNDFSHTVTATCAGTGVVTVTPTEIPSVGYFCDAFTCALPIKGTLQFTNGVGTWGIAHNAPVQWQVAHNVPLVAGGTVLVNWIYGNGTLAGGYVLVGIQHLLTIATTARACAPSFLWQGTIHDPSGLTTAVNGTGTITE